MTRSITRTLVSAIPVLLSAAGCAQVAFEEQRPGVPVLVDTHGSPQAHVGLLMLLSHPRVRVNAVIAGEGAAEADRAEVAARRVLRFTDHYSVETSTSLRRPPRGFPDGQRKADTDLDRCRALNNIRRGPPGRLNADQLTAEAIRASAEPTVIIGLGPATHLHASLSAAPDLLSRLEAVYLSSGNLADYPTPPPPPPRPTPRSRCSTPPAG